MGYFLEFPGLSLLSFSSVLSAKVLDFEFLDCTIYACFKRISIRVDRNMLKSCFQKRIF